MTRRRQLHELPLRSVRGYPHQCVVCLGDISADDHRYHDGGWPRRAHMDCAAMVGEGKRREITRAELRQLDAAEVAVSKAKGELYRRKQLGLLLRREKVALQQAQLDLVELRHELTSVAGGGTS